MHRIILLKVLKTSIAAHPEFAAGRIFVAICVFIVPLAFTCDAMAGDYHSHNDIRNTAHAFLRHQLMETATGHFEITVNTLDQRLKLSRCDDPLEAFLPPGGRLFGKTTVGVRCGNPKPWKVFIPVTLAMYEKVLAAKRTLLRGQVISAEDLTIVENEVGATSRNHFYELKQATGLIAKRSIAAGKILTARMLKAPRLVQRGQEVILLAITPQLEVRMKGKALGDGSKGDVIRVRNTRTKRVVEGVVTHTGVVKVSM